MNWYVVIEVLLHLLCLIGLLGQTRIFLLYHLSRPPVEVSLASLVTCDVARAYRANFAVVLAYSFCLTMEIRW